MSATCDATPDQPRSQTDLPSELLFLVGRWPSPLVSAVEITGIRAANPALRSTWKLTFEDGRIVKGRCGQHARRLDPNGSPVASLRTERFAQLLDSNGNATLEEWIDGDCLRDIPLTPDLLRDAGRLLGEIHTAASPQKQGCQNTVSYRYWYESALLRFILADAIRVADAAVILDLLSRRRPEWVDFGLTHRDLCAENLVLRNGILCSIDHWTMGARALDEDLARTAYRWPLSSDEWQLFLEGYEEHRSAESYRTHHVFWQSFVTLMAADTHSRLTGIESAIARLKALLTELGSCHQASSGCKVMLDREAA